MKCSYCSKEIKEGKGTMFVHKIGAIKYFCSSKCLKKSNQNIKLNKKIISNNKK